MSTTIHDNVHRVAHAINFYDFSFYLYHQDLIQMFSISLMIWNLVFCISHILVHFLFCLVLPQNLNYLSMPLCRYLVPDMMLGYLLKFVKINYFVVHFRLVNRYVPKLFRLKYFITILTTIKIRLF